MIAYIQGTILAKGSNYLIVIPDTIGYRVFVSSEIVSESPQGAVIELFTYHSVKEDAQDLYGFRTQSDLAMFEKLISISGVGPKSALGVLAAASVQELESAIVRGDASILTKVSGIGKKTAERIVLELKGKISSFEIGSQGHEVSQDVEVLEALESLGYSLEHAREALQQLDSSLSVDAKIKEALRYLGR
jgi:Holliday junction DNA helicase RuvA